MIDGAKILVIDDEPEIRKLLHLGLKAHGFTFIEASTGEEGLNRAAIDRPDLIVLDMGLPDLDGLEMVTRLREWSTTPILILSVREQDNDKIQALDRGADDYLTKPFSMGELMARLRVALRHKANTKDEPVIVNGNLVIDFAHRQISISGEKVKLTPTEYEILKVLSTNLGKVVTHRQLLTAVWGKDYAKENHYLRIFIGQLRKKIEPNVNQPIYIITEPGVGYRLQVQEIESNG
ncbi:MAG: response regulator [Candidatus Saccharibacteria bacterium]